MNLRPSTRAALLALSAVVTAPVEARQSDLQLLPGEADGSLAGPLADALQARDMVGEPWPAEARVRAWSTRLSELLAGTAESDEALRIVDRRAPLWARLFDQDGLVVERRIEAEGGEPRAWLVPPAELGTALGPYSGGAGRSAFKIVGVDLDPSGPRTLVRATTFALDSGRRIQHTALWRVHWSPDDERNAPAQLEWLTEERATLAGTAAAFVDCSASAFVQPPAEPLTLPLDGWRRRLDSLLGTGLLGHQGLALGDVDGDGWEDLYVCQPGGLPNRLFVSRAGGPLENLSSESGADFLDPCSSALLLHFDDDAHTDLVVATSSELLFLAGDGDGHFALRTRVPASTTTSLCASDVDLDGDLDVYACGYVSPYDDSATPVPYHDANNGARNQLLRNDGAFRFVDVTSATGLDVNNRRFSFAAAWEDYDRDGDPDLYVANDFGRNNLYRNDAGHFTDVAPELGVEDIAAGMGVAWGDVDRDGWDDLYVSNMFSAAGSRVAFEAAFHPSAPPAVRGALRHHARGNTLFRNVAGEGFDDVTESAGVGMGLWAWGSILFDANDDGWLDVLVPNGMITGQRDDDL